MRAKSVMRLFTLAVLIAFTGAIDFDPKSSGVFAQGFRPEGDADAGRRP